MMPVAIVTSRIEKPAALLNLDFAKAVHLNHLHAAALVELDKHGSAADDRPLRARIAVDSREIVNHHADPKRQFDQEPHA